MKKILLLTLVLIISIDSFGSVQDVQTANQIAQTFIQQNIQGYAIKNHSTLTSGNAELYHLEPKGFIIISLNDYLPPIYAYSFSSNLTSNNPYIQLFEEDMGLRLVYYQQHLEKTVANQRAWQNLLQGIELVYQQFPSKDLTFTGGWITTSWYQGDPNENSFYNKYCPKVDEKRCYSGCVAISMAQVINYHKNIFNTSFTHDNDFYSFYYDYYDGNRIEITIDNSNETYNYPPFSNLTEKMESINEKFQKSENLTDDDIAALIFACGVSAEMDYNEETSEARHSVALNALKDRFHFNHSVLLENTDAVVFMNRIKENVISGKPVIIGMVGKDQNGNSIGHSAIVDGFRSNEEYHINCGWGSDWQEYWWNIPDNLPGAYTKIEEGIFDIIGNETLTNVNQVEILSDIIFPASGTKYYGYINNVTVQNLVWSATNNTEWFTSCTPLSGTLDPGRASIIEIEYSENCGTSLQMGDIAFSWTGGSEVATMTQYPDEMLYSSLRIADFPRTGGTISRVIGNKSTYSKTWYISQKPDWITVNPSSSTLASLEEISISISASENNSSPKNGNITISCSCGIPITINVSQEGINDPRIKWTYPLDSEIRSCPAIDGNGNIYIVSKNGKILAISNSGDPRWQKSDLGINNSNSSPIINNSGKIILGGYFGTFPPRAKLFIINPANGSKENEYIHNSYPGTFRGSPVSSQSGLIYFIVSREKQDESGHFIIDIGELVAINSDCSVRWAYLTNVVDSYNIFSSPVTTDEGSIYFVSGSYLFRIKEINGVPVEQWSLNLGCSDNSSPILGGDGTIYIGSNGLYAINPEGTIKWYYPLNDAVTSPPVISANGTIYFGSENGYVYALNPNGGEKWKYNTESVIKASPVISNDGNIYFCTVDKKVYAFNPVNQTLLWVVYGGESFKSSPTINSNGYLFVGSTVGKLYAIDTETGSGIGNTPWPKDGQNLKNNSISLNKVIELANKDLDEKNIEGTLSFDNALTESFIEFDHKSSLSTVSAFPGPNYHLQTDQSSINGKHFLMWDDVSQYWCKRDVNFIDNVNYTAHFTTKKYVNINSTLPVQIEIHEPWLVTNEETLYQPDCYRTISPGSYSVFLNQNAAYDDELPIYSLKAPHYAATTDGIYTFTGWTASPPADASFKNASSCETAVVFSKSPVTVTANYSTKVSNQANYTATIPSGETLTIPAGASIAFASGFKFNILGKLQVVGTTDNPITFESSNPAFSWEGFLIELNTSNPNKNELIVSNCIIKNATNLVRVSNNIDGWAKIKMNNCVIPSLSYNNPEISWWDEEDNGYIIRYFNMFSEDAVDIDIDRCTFNGGKYLSYGIAEWMNSTVTNTIFNGAKIYINTDVEIDLFGNDFFNCELGEFSSGWWDLLHINHDLPDGWINITSDPLFLNISNEDYYLKINSPCIDKGWINSINDPDGTRADIGSYYFPQVTASGTISSDATWFGKISIEDNVTIASGVKLKIIEGSKILIPPGKMLRVYGTLEAKRYFC